MSEKLIAKFAASFIFKIPYGPNPVSVISDKRWIDGIVYLTTENLYFSFSDKKSRLSLSKIIDVKNSYVPPRHIIIISYSVSDRREHLIISSTRESVGSLKHRILVLTGKKANVKEAPGELEKKLLMLIYIGVEDIPSIKFFLNIEGNKVSEVFHMLKEKGYTDDIGKLTYEGTSLARKLKELESAESVH